MSTTVELLAANERYERLLSEHRALVSRLGFGNGITEPMADNDTIVAWFEEQGRGAAEWREHESAWLNECMLADCPEDEDCYEHHPHLQQQAAEQRYERLRAAVEELADEWESEAADDQAWLDGPRVAASEARELPALIRQSREHIRALRGSLATT